jgi:hypothetical protein
VVVVVVVDLELVALEKRLLTEKEAVVEVEAQDLMQALAEPLVALVVVCHL